MKRQAMLLLAAFASAAACNQTSLEDCEKIQHQSKCEDADVDGVGACRWVDVYRPSGSGEDCDPGEPVGSCVGIGGTQEGCGGFGCDPGSEGEPPNLYFRHDGSQVEVFASPDCGPEPVGPWTSCVGANPPAECGCLCGIADPPP